VIGGCLAMLETQLLLDAAGFSHEACEGCVLALETSGETPQAAMVERFVRALGERGILESVRGLLVGRPETPGGSPEKRTAYRRRQRRTIAATVDEYADLPVVFDLDFGHTAPILPLPMGAPVTIDPGARTIRFTAQSR
jgi:muramoyltetrapeptide carboxypeptidase LdcA involved in peptidoglycan recycling